MKDTTSQATSGGNEGTYKEQKRTRSTTAKTTTQGQEIPNIDQKPNTVANNSPETIYSIYSTVQNIKKLSAASGTAKVPSVWTDTVKVGAVKPGLQKSSPLYNNPYFMGLTGAIITLSAVLSLILYRSIRDQHTRREQGRDNTEDLNMAPQVTDFRKVHYERMQL